MRDKLSEVVTGSRHALLVLKEIPNCHPVYSLFSRTIRVIYGWFLLFIQEFSGQPLGALETKVLPVSPAPPVVLLRKKRDRKGFPFLSFFLRVAISCR
jgi:hypothetical protein